MKSRHSAFDLLICDCDGVLVDSEIVADRILVETITSLYPGRGAETVLANGFGTQTEVLLARVADHLGEALPVNFSEELRNNLDRRLALEAEPIRGIRQALETAGLPVAV
ncbi:MAG TPA: HAD family hydrolase, partial [Candidatus Nitrosotalea sp.]|nr:HAD family hydrolase [Candidatus Nitrosotalea sp.]